VRRRRQYRLPWGGVAAALLAGARSRRILRSAGYQRSASHASRRRHRRSGDRLRRVARSLCRRRLRRASCSRRSAALAPPPGRRRHAYLVARSAVRAAIEDKTPKLIAEAQQAIDALATDPQFGEYRADAPKLASLLAFATHPQERARELERSLLAADLPPTLAVDLRDFLL